MTDSGLLFTRVPLDREERSSHTLTVVKGQVRMKLLLGSLSAKNSLPSALVRVDVDDDNDNSPAFDRHVYQGNVRLSVSDTIY